MVELKGIEPRPFPIGRQGEDYLRFVEAALRVMLDRVPLDALLGSGARLAGFEEHSLGARPLIASTRFLPRCLAC